MAVTFTPNIGLAKPDETEQAINWANVQKLAEDNNIIVIDKSEFPLQSYTPTIIGPTTNPSVGAGVLAGEYLEFQGWVFGGFGIRFTDPGVSAGSGAGGYLIKLPTLADITFHTAGTLFNDGVAAATHIGEAYFYDASAVVTSGSVALDLIRVGGIDYARMITETYTGKTERWVGPGHPVTLANGDLFEGSFIYKRG